MPTMPSPFELDLTDPADICLDRGEAEGFASSTLTLDRIILEKFVAFAGCQGRAHTTEPPLERLDILGRNDTKAEGCSDRRPTLLRRDDVTARWFDAMA